jgi:hypothetical protein
MSLPMKSNQFLNLGRQWSRRVPTYVSLDEVGRRMGMTKQMAWYESNVALGKIIYRLRQQMIQNQNDV